ncbi:hypothetical protein ACWGO7_08035 [Bacillus haynesii]|uniref:hypothetical protein n=1 Tax=Bacillus haynesii TaxID=1925021 RepID=UPI0035DB3BF6
MIRQGRNKEEIRARLDRADIDYAASSKCDYSNEKGDIKNAVCEIKDYISRHMSKERDQILTTDLFLCKLNLI